MSYVLLECGSSARGDANPRSDIDIVCIWRGAPPDYRELSLRYKDVVFYSEDTIARMKSKGSLFITHLDVDSKYVEGERGLIDLIASYRPGKFSLKRNLKITREFLRGVTWYPSNPLGEFWLLDVLYVALRNYVFCSNALNGVYRFGFVDALRYYGFDSRRLQVMLMVRDGKYSYRSKDKLGSSVVNVSDLEEVCTWLLGTPLKFSSGGVTDWTFDCSNEYWAERLLERAILNGEHEDNGFLERMKAHSYNKVLLKKEVRRIYLEHRS